MTQRVLSEKGWFDRMIAKDVRGLTLMIYAHVNPFGTFHLDMRMRLALESEEATG